MRAFDADVTEDALLGGRVRVKQPARGYRVNADTVLLASSIEALSGAHVLEAGCGVGAALLCAAARLDARFTGLERDPAYAALARENVAANGANAEIVEADLFIARDLGVFDAVFFNPPFDTEGEGRGPAPERRAAHIAERPIEDWIAKLANHLKGGARLTLIHRARALPEILAAFKGRLGGVEIMPIRPRAEEGAKRVLVRAAKGSRAPLALYRGLDLHNTGGAKFTPEADALFRGEALIWR
ncbi:MAG: tRNA1(Val) (adenine(37)-N6)-methyltransferase [Hyphomonadaceae bacterium]